MIYLVGNPYVPKVLAVGAQLVEAFDVPVRAIWTENANYHQLPEEVRDLAHKIGGEPPLPPMVKVRVGTVPEAIAWATGDVGTNNVAYVHVDVNNPPKPYQVTGLGLFDAVVVGTAEEVLALQEAGYAKPLDTDLLDAVRPFLVQETSIRYIIPFKGRSVEMAGDLVRALKAEMKPCDEIVISDLGSSKRKLVKLHHLASSTGITLVREECELWNMSKARNNGFKAPGQRFDIVCSVDVDLVVPEGFTAEVREKALDKILVPFARTVDGPNRFASGASAIPALWVEEVRGWDEEYEGYGSEDIDLTYRIGELFEQGTVVYSLRGDIVFDHHEHAATSVKEEYGQRNMQRFQDRQNGKLGEVNPHGWGEGSTCYVERGRPRITMWYHHLGNSPSNPAHELSPADIAKPPKGVGF